MSPRSFTADVFLWLFVVAFSLQMGAGLYEMRVVTPLWSSSPPESVRAWNADERRRILPRERFWRYCTPLVGLAALAALVWGCAAGGRRRRWLLGATLPVVVSVVVTYAYFAPELAELLGGGGAGMSDEELTTRAERWLALRGLGAVVYTVAWLSALRALSIPSAGRDE